MNVEEFYRILMKIHIISNVNQYQYHLSEISNCDNGHLIQIEDWLFSAGFQGKEECYKILF